MNYRNLHNILLDLFNSNIFYEDMYSRGYNPNIGLSPSLAVICDFCQQWLFSVCILLLLFLVFRRPALLSYVHSNQLFTCSPSC